MSRIPSTMATVQRAYKVRCYPTPEQAERLEAWFGVRRFTWNVALEMITRAYKARGERLTWIDVDKQFTQLRRDPNFAWFAALPKDARTQVLRDLHRAYKNFFARRARYPRFESKRRPKRALRFVFDPRHGGKVRAWNDGHLELSKLGRLALRGTPREKPSPEVLARDPQAGRRALPAAMPKMVSIRRDAAGRWFVSFMVEETVASLPKTGTHVGVDVGLKTLAVASDGWEAPNPRHLARHLRALKRASRALSRKVGAKRGQKRSGRFVRQQQRVARLHAKVADARRDYLHKATTALVKSHDLIAVEDLHVKGMVRNRRLARHLGDAALGELRRQLTYKAEWYGRELAVIDRWAPSSKTCSACLAPYDGTLTLAVRDWTCRACGTHHDRDLNAARNILAFALGAGGSEVMRVEGDTHREAPEGSGVERHPVKREEAANRAGLHGAGP